MFVTARATSLPAGGRTADTLSADSNGKGRPLQGSRSRTVNLRGRGFSSRVGFEPVASVPALTFVGDADVAAGTANCGDAFVVGVAVFANTRTPTTSTSKTPPVTQ